MRDGSEDCRRNEMETEKFIINGRGFHDNLSRQIIQVTNNRQRKMLHSRYSYSYKPNRWYVVFPECITDCVTPMSYVYSTTYVTVGGWGFMSRVRETHKKEKTDRERERVCVCKCMHNWVFVSSSK